MSRNKFTTLKAVNLILWLVLIVSLSGIVIIDQFSSELGFGHKLTLFLDSNSLNSNTDTRTRSGFLWIPRTGDYQFTLKTDGGVTLSIDTEKIFDDSNHGAIYESTKEIYLEEGWQAIELIYAYDPEAIELHLADLSWKTPNGLISRRVPSWALFSDPLPSLKPLGLYRLLWEGLRYFAVFSVLGLLIFLARQFKVNRRVALSLLILFVLAFGLRTTFLSQRMANDPTFLTLPNGTDHRGYELTSRNLSQGQWPDSEKSFYFQPGVTYELYFLHLLFGPNIWSIRLASALLDSIAALTIFFTTRQLFNDERAAWVATFLAVFYPPYIFYASTGLITPMAIFFVALQLWRFSYFFRRKNWLDAILLGFIYAAIIATRQNQMLFLPLALVWMFWVQKEERRQLILMGSTIIIMANLIVLPLYLHNDHNSPFLTTSGPVTMYLDNNRDSRGYYSYNQAFRASITQGISYEQAFKEDVINDPVRWGQLLLYKAGLFWSSNEVISNIGYISKGTRPSALLRTLQFYNFGSVAFLALIGGTLAAIKRHRESQLLYLFIFTAMMPLMLFSTGGRFRAPVVVGLFPLAGYAVMTIYDTLMLKKREGLFQLAKISIAVSVVLVLLNLATTKLPLPHLYRASRLPAEVIAIDQDFDQKIKLVGYQIVVGDEGVEPDNVLLFKLYWQQLAPLDADYTVNFSLINFNGEIIAQLPIELGSVSFQTYPTSQWKTNKIFEEEYLLVPNKKALTPSGANLWVSLIKDKDSQALSYNEDGDIAFLLTTIRIIDKKNKFSETPQHSLSYHFKWAELRGYDLMLSESQLDLTLYWQGTATAPSGNYQIFIHALDQSGNLVAQKDTVPLNQFFPVTLWRAGDYLIDPYQFFLPTDLPEGEYKIYVGLWDLVTGARVEIKDDQGNIIPDASLYLETITTE